MDLCIIVLRYPLVNACVFEPRAYAVPLWEVQMPFDPEPPSSVTEPLSPPSITTLCNLIHGVQLPKSKAAKSCSVPLSTWKNICTIVSALAANTADNATASLPSLSAQLSSMQSQLSNLSNLIPTSPTNTSKAHKPSYASVAATTPSSPPALKAVRNTSCDLTLTPIDKHKPAFTAVTPSDILKQFNALMDRLSIRIAARAVAKHRNGNLRLTLEESSDVKELLEKKDSWLPVFSNLLTTHSPTYAVIIHRVPTTLDVDGYTGPYPGRLAGVPGVDELIEANSTVLDAREITRIHWISSKARTTKKFSSLVLHFSDIEAADLCIHEKVALHGTFLPTEKFRPRPVQCFNCYRFGHIARVCTQPAICGQCAAPHSTNKCHCPHQPTCTKNSKCSHIVHKCALCECNGTHPALSPECPVRHAILARFALEHAASGSYFGDAPASKE